MPDLVEFFFKSPPNLIWASESCLLLHVVTFFTCLATVVVHWNYLGFKLFLGCFVNTAFLYWAARCLHVVAFIYLQIYIFIPCRKKTFILTRSITTLNNNNINKKQTKPFEQTNQPDALFISPPLATVSSSSFYPHSTLRPLHFSKSIFTKVIKRDRTKGSCL